MALSLFYKLMFLPIFSVNTWRPWKANTSEDSAGIRFVHSLRCRRLKGKGKGVLGAREREAFPFLLPSSRPSRFAFRVSPFPFPFKRLPRRLLHTLRVSMYFIYWMHLGYDSTFNVFIIDYFLPVDKILSFEDWVLIGGVARLNTEHV